MALILPDIYEFQRTWLVRLALIFGKTSFWSKNFNFNILTGRQAGPPKGVCLHIYSSSTQVYTPVTHRLIYVLNY